MAIGFQQKGMFGRRAMDRNPWDTPGIGDGLNQPEMGAMPANVAPMTKKAGFFGQGGIGRGIAGTIGDFLLQQSGMQPIYGPSVMQQRDAEERMRMAQQQWSQRREDMQWEWANKPKDAPNNDTINDFNWYRGLSEEERKLYHKMKPTVAFRADGTPIAVNPYDLSAGGSPSDVPTAPVGKLRPIGGQAATPPVTFRR
jgi:hypothetical protein